jgi:hypothetical protein
VGWRSGTGRSTRRVPCSLRLGPRGVVEELEGIRVGYLRSDEERCRSEKVVPVASRSKGAICRRQKVGSRRKDSLERDRPT